jgi:NAD(P)-dependent dehydrogenase (short-subunit alcohol dehydrogenase family)
MRTIAVTGSASGIGAATVALLRANGNRVIGVDLHDAEIEADLSTSAGRTEAIRGVRSLADGTLNGLVTCAGLSPGAHDEPRVLAVNFFGTAELLLALRPDLARCERPAAVAVSSWAMMLPLPRAAAIAACLAMDEATALALVTSDPRVGTVWPAYATSKAAVSRLVRRLAPTSHWAGAGIALNVVVPGVTRTPMIARHLASEDAKRALLAAAPSPLGRIAEAEDVAEVIVFLVSGRARHIVGQALFVDGGLEALRRGESSIEPLND